MSISGTSRGILNFSALVMATMSIGACDTKKTAGGASDPVGPSNQAPVASAVTVNTNYRSAVAVTLSATDAESDTITYSVVSAPTKGTISGTAPNITYTPGAGQFGIDTLTYKASDSTQDSALATATIQIAQPPTVYLTTTGDDSTAIADNATKPFRTAQAAYAAALTLQTSTASDVILLVGTGTFAGITLTSDWNSSVHLSGTSASQSNLGGINGDGYDGAYYEHGVSQSIPHCVELANAIALAFPYDGDNCHVSHTRGRQIELFGANVNVGDISSNTGMNNWDNAWTDESLERVNITMHNGLTAHDVRSNNRSFLSYPGNIVIEKGASARDVTASSVGDAGMGGDTGTDPISGGTITVGGTVTGTISAIGRPNQIDGGGRGGTVTVQVDGVAGNIDVRGGGFSFDGPNYKCLVGQGIGTYSGRNCYWNNNMGRGGIVNVYGTVGEINANGGDVPTRTQSYLETYLYAGPGGTVTIFAGGIAQDIYASASATVGTNYNTSGASGGSITVQGQAGNIYANGSAPGTLAATSGLYYDAGSGMADSLSEIAGGSGGHIVLSATAKVGNVQANGTTFRPPVYMGSVDFSYMDMGGYSAASLGGNGGTIELTGSPQHGTLSYANGTDGFNVGAVGTVIQH